MTIDYPSPKALLDKYGFRAKKSWGQNFLIDPRIHEAIARATVAAPDDWVVEIGAGLGTLTARLAAAAPAGRVLAVERDRDMVQVLEAELGAVPNVEVIAQNALELDYGALAARAGRPLAVAGNLPYQIASPLLFAMLAARRHLTRAVVMLQKEMADRILASPGTKTYGALGVMVTTWADVRSVIRARAGAFLPPPKVDSTVIAMTPLPAPRAPLDDEARYSVVVHAAFGQRRKTLKNALRARWDAGAVDQALAATGLDGGRRGETLTVAEFAALANRLPDARAT